MESTAFSHAQRGVLANALSIRLARLETRRTTRLRGLSRVEEAHLARDEEAGDEAQRAGDREVQALVAASEDTEFDAVANAIQRIHGIGYGLCADCDAQIPFARLKVEPQATRCAACEALHESVA